MKKFTLLFVSIVILGNINAQTILIDNGPLINHVGQGAGGADVSATHDGLTIYGSGHAISSSLRVADEFTIPSSTTWLIDSIIFYAYQTNSTTSSTITEMHLQIWNGSPGVAGSTIIYGDTLTDVLFTSSWSGIYRTDGTTLTNTDRPIMKNVINFSSTLPVFSLAAGTYWLDWRTGGDPNLNGPWAPLVTYPTQTTTGNAQQYSPATPGWSDLIDAGTSTAQGLPFIIYGTSGNTGINESEKENSVNVFPNPFNNAAMVRINSSSIVPSEKGFNFLIYDLLGKKVKTINNIKSSQFTINREDLGKGIYTYKLWNDKEHVKTGKLVID